MVHCQGINHSNCAPADVNIWAPRCLVWTSNMILHLTSIDMFLRHNLVKLPINSAARGAKSCNYRFRYLALMMPSCLNYQRCILTSHLWIQLDVVVKFVNKRLLKKVKK